MALGNSKASVLAIVEEVTEGTPVDPSAATDYVPLQPGANMVPAFDVLENQELRNSIGKAKGSLGIERPTFNLPKYLKHSGVEGQAPEGSLLYEAFFGSKSTNSTERSTTSSSSVSVVKLGAGGSDFARGKAILLKDGTNGYSIRPVHSVSTNDLTLGFDLANAPASGVACGKCVNYAPASSGHKALTVWKYDGNGHATEMIAGMKVTDWSFSASAGDYINGSFGLTGVKFFMNPIRLAATDIKLDFYDGTTDFTATLTAKVYRTPNELAAAIQTAMRAVASSSAYSCTYSSTTGKFTFTKSSGTFQLKWSTGSNTANTIGDKIGFNTAADDTGALTYTSDNAQTYASPYTPSFDTAEPIAAKNHEILIGDSTDTVAFEAAQIDFNGSNTRSEIKSICAESGVNSNIITGRAITIKMQALLSKYDTDKLRRLTDNTDTRFCYNFGTKSGGNWVAGTCGCLYIPTCTVKSFQTVDLDSVIGVEIELEAFVDSSGNGEVYLSYL